MPIQPEIDSNTVRAQRIAADWHGGQWTALYSLCSTGTVWSGEHRARLIAEIDHCQTELPDEDSEMENLIWLAAWVKHARLEVP